MKTTNATTKTTARKTPRDEVEDLAVRNFAEALQRPNATVEANAETYARNCTDTMFEMLVAALLKARLKGATSEAVLNGNASDATEAYTNRIRLVRDLAHEML